MQVTFTGIQQSSISHKDYSVELSHKAKYVAKQDLDIQLKDKLLCKGMLVKGSVYVNCSRHR